jgi:hypothetical protein
LNPKKSRETVQLHVRIDRISHGKLVDCAGEAGMTKAIWLEQAIIANKTVIAPQERPGLNGLLYQVCRAGNNINQLARSFNVLLLMETITAADFADAMAQLALIDALLDEAIAYAG